MKTVIITGAISGIGKAIAIACLKQKYTVIAHYRTEKPGLDELMHIAHNNNVILHTYSCDLSLEDSVKSFYEFCVSKVRSIDFLINNAGGYIGEGDEWDGDSDVWLQTYQSNVLPVLLCSKYFAQYFLEKRQGSIINIASRYSISGSGDCIAYSSCKSAIVNITQAYAKILAPYGTANAISPGAVNTGYWLNAPQEEIDEVVSKIALKKLIEPDEVAKTIIGLLVNNASLTGQNILIDAGYSLI